jgi:hypothetical protein
MADLNTDDWVDIPSHFEKSISIDPAIALADEDAENAFYDSTAKLALSRMSQNPSPIFTTALSHDGLWSDYMDKLHPSRQQRFNCEKCKRFLRRYGALVQVDDAGCIQPLLWPTGNEDVPSCLHASIRAMYHRISSAPVLDEFKINKDDKLAGLRTQGGWNHFYLDFPDGRTQKQDPVGFAYAPTSVLAAMCSIVCSKTTI